MKNFLIRILSILLSYASVILAFKAGVAGIFNAYGLIPSKAIMIIFEKPIIILVAYILLLLLTFSFGCYIIYKNALLIIEPFTSRLFIKQIFLSLIAGLDFSFCYWCVFQIIAIIFLLNR